MKRFMVCILTSLCVLTMSAQKYSKVETKARQYAEKYERVGNELSISFVQENIALSRQQIYGKFEKLLAQQYKITADDIEERDALAKTVKCSLERKITTLSDQLVVKCTFSIKLAAKEGKARISIKTNGYTHYRGRNVSAEETVCSRPPFVELDKNTSKGEKVTDIYCDTFLELDSQIEEIIKDFTEFWQK